SATVWPTGSVPATTPLSRSAMDDAGPFLLEVEDLVVEFRGAHGSVLANNHVSLRIRAGETLGIVGEAGSGKSVFCRALLPLLPSAPAHVRADRIVFAGRDLQALTETKMRQVRGLEIAMIFQNPMSSLNPVWPIGDQVSEGLRVHRGVSQRDGRQRAVALLRRVGIPSPAIRGDDQP